MKVSNLTYTKVSSEGCRFDSSFYLNDNSYLSMIVEAIPNSKLLGDLAEVFNPSIFKRQFCIPSAKATYYFQSSDVPSASEFGHIYISRQQSARLNLLVKKGDILITGFGSIGSTRLVGHYQDGTCYANNVCRIRCNSYLPTGYVYAVLSSKYGYAQLNKNASGSVVKYIEAPGIKKTVIPFFSTELQKCVDTLIKESASLREEATNELALAEKLLKEKAGLHDLTPDDYDYFGHHSASRRPSCFIRKASSIRPKSINAFNYSERIATIYGMIPNSEPLKNILKNGSTFSTGSFPRVEVKDGCGVMLINQSDAFDTIIKGKWISKRNVNLTSLVEYGEVIVAGVGTLGENETFCRTLFGNEDMVGQLISGEFIRMKTNGTVPSGYLYAWLSSDYGFRLIRNTQAGTKLCRPIPDLFLEIPIPILHKEDMDEIDRLVRTAHTKRHEANVKELKAISMVEAEIEKWK